MSLILNDLLPNSTPTVAFESGLKVFLRYLFNIFVLPEYQGKGVGRKIIEALEKDEYFLRAKRVEIPASITACEFYKKMGYTYKNGIDVVDEEQLFRLEKFR